MVNYRCTSIFCWIMLQAKKQQEHGVEASSRQTEASTMFCHILLLMYELVQLSKIVHKLETINKDLFNCRG